jgi:hypothetical protein
LDSNEQGIRAGPRLTQRATCGLCSTTDQFAYIRFMSIFGFRDFQLVDRKNISRRSQLAARY